MIGRSFYLLAALLLLSGAAPCDSVVCAEGYSMVRALTTVYTGPLFQLNNGSSNLDIGQVNGVVDLSTWKAFCSGVTINCKISKIYAQIHTGGTNDLVPSTVAAVNNNCSGGGALFCAVPFQIDETGYPVLVTTQPQHYNIGGTDIAMTGLTANGAKISIAMVARVVPFYGYCCGNFMNAHQWNAPCCFGGTDFGFAVLFGAAEGLATTFQDGIFVLGADFESNGGGISPSITGVNIADLIMAMSFDPTANSGVGAYTFFVNSSTVLRNNKTDGVCPVASGDPCPNVAPAFIHVGGGGDASGPAPIYWREGFWTNTVLSSTDVANILAGTKPLFPRLAFPTFQ